ncbi:putative envelope protein [Atlantic salmon bafinivirus]|nr:putative envelope protein [Atlantic salmon bafinivirus]
MLSFFLLSIMVLSFLPLWLCLLTTFRKHTHSTIKMSLSTYLILNSPLLKEVILSWLLLQLQLPVLLQRILPFLVLFLPLQLRTCIVSNLLSRPTLCTCTTPLSKPLLAYF